MLSDPPGRGATLIPGPTSISDSRVWIFWNRKKIITDKLGQCSVSYLITLFHPSCNVSDENTHVNWSWRTGTCFEMPLRKFVVYTMVHFRKKIPILVSQPFVLHAGAIKISIKSAISLAQYFLKIDRLTNSDYESWVKLKDNNPCFHNKFTKWHLFLLKMSLGP